MASLQQLYRNAFGGLSREVWILSITQFINRCGSMVIFFLAVYLEKDLSFSLERVGIAMACFGAGGFLGTYLGGYITDRWSPYFLLRFALLAGGVIFILVSFIQEFYMMCIALFVLSAVADSFRPANMTAISLHSTPETYTRSMSLHRLAVNLGFSIGPYIGGLLKDYNVRWIFWADGLTCIIASLVIISFFKTERFHEHVKGSKKGLVKVPAWKDYHYLMFLGVVVLYVMSFFQFFSTMSLYYENVEHLNGHEYGFLFMLNGLIVAAVELILIMKIGKALSPYRFIALGTFVMILAYLVCTFFVGWWWMVLVTVFISVSEMLAMPFMVNIMNARSDVTNKGSYASLYSMAWSIGQIMIPLVVTNVLSISSYFWVWMTMLAITTTGIVVILFLERHRGNLLKSTNGNK